MKGTVFCETGSNTQCPTTTTRPSKHHTTHHLSKTPHVVQDKENTLCDCPTKHGVVVGCPCCEMKQLDFWSETGLSEHDSFSKTQQTCWGLSVWERLLRSMSTPPRHHSPSRWAYRRGQDILVGVMTLTQLSDEDSPPRVGGQRLQQLQPSRWTLGTAPRWSNSPPPHSRSQRTTRPRRGCPHFHRKLRLGGDPK